MEQLQLATIAGIISSSIFAASNIPMLVKAFRTKDLRSYSLVYILCCNIGNLFHWFYILSLPAGPIWLLHAFYTVSTLLMLLWFLRYKHRWEKLDDNSGDNSYDAKIIVEPVTSIGDTMATSTTWR